MTIYKNALIASNDNIEEAAIIVQSQELKSFKEYLKNKRDKLNANLI